MKCMLIGKQGPVTHTDHERVKLRFKGYEKLVLKEIEKAKGEYFNRVFTAYRSDMKKTWQVINETLSRNSKKIDMPSEFIHETCELADPTEIANAFNSYFANIGKKLSSKIEHDDITVDYKQFLNLPAVETCSSNVLPKKLLLRQ